jgi:hypothetical protein
MRGSAAATGAASLEVDAANTGSSSKGACSTVDTLNVGEVPSLISLEKEYKG